MIRKGVYFSIAFCCVSDTWTQVAEESDCGVLAGTEELQRIQALNPQKTKKKKRYVMERMTSGLIRSRGESLV